MVEVCTSHCKSKILKLIRFQHSSMFKALVIKFTVDIFSSPLFFSLLPTQGAWVHQWNFLPERAFLLWMLWLKWYVGSVKG